jgi:hypothetical protein
MKLEARKLHNAANNNNVFCAVGYTCATAWKSEPSQKSAYSVFPTGILYLTNCQRATCGVQACRRARNSYLLILHHNQRYTALIILTSTAKVIYN